MTAGTVDVTRHDISLLGIAVVLLTGILVAQFSSIRLFRSLFLSSLPAAACVVYVLFYNPPDGTE